MKKIKSIVAVFLAIVTMSAVSVCASAANTITPERAKQAALTHAKLNEADVEFIQVEMDYDDGLYVYEVEFFSGNLEYEYTINAKSAKIIEWDKEYDDDHRRTANPPKAEKPAAPTVKPKPEKKAVIELDAAKKAALDHAGFCVSDVKFTKAELDRDDGKSTYEIEFRKGRVEYDYEIDAFNGGVLKAEKDVDDDYIQLRIGSLFRSWFRSLLAR